MSGKSKLSLLSSCTIVFLLLLCFNNCAPLGTPLGGLGDSSLSSAGSTLAKSTFASSVQPALQTACNSCHSAAGTASDSIYTYAFAKSFAMNGPTSINNALINKINGTTAHVGGTLCANMTVSPCKEIKQWIVIENPMKSTIPVGMVQSVSNTGAVRGWAIDPLNPTTTITVSIYGNTSFASGGTLTMTVPANGNGSAPYSGHYFTAQLPPSMVDATQRNIYVYAGSTSPDALFIASPTTYKAYGPTPEGQTYYSGTLTGGANKLAACAACHDGSVAAPFTYATAFNFLSTPFPDKGGTNLNNSFINNALGKNGHPGGVRCANAGVEPCLSIKMWWDIEFGP